MVAQFTEAHLLKLSIREANRSQEFLLHWLLGNVLGAMNKAALPN